MRGRSSYGKSTSAFIVAVTVAASLFAVAGCGSAGGEQAQAKAKDAKKRLEAAGKILGEVSKEQEKLSVAAPGADASAKLKALEKKVKTGTATADGGIALLEEAKSSPDASDDMKAYVDKKLKAAEALKATFTLETAFNKALADSGMQSTSDSPDAMIKAFKQGTDELLKTFKQVTEAHIKYEEVDVDAETFAADKGLDI